MPPFLILIQSSCNTNGVAAASAHLGKLKQPAGVIRRAAYYELRLGPHVAAGFSQAAQAIRTDDDVVDHFHAQQIAGFDQCLRHLDVLVARSQRASGMIVRNDHCNGIGQDCRFEYLARMDQTG